MNVNKFEKLVCGAIVATISIASVVIGVYFSYLVIIHSFDLC